MDEFWFQLLVIIMSSLLIIILIIVIVLLAKFLKIANSIKKITDKTEVIVDKADDISSFFQKTTTSVALVKLVSNISEAFTKKGKK